MVTDIEYREHEEWKKQQDSTYLKLVRDIEPIHFLIIIGLIGFLIYLINNYKENKSTVYIFGFLIVLTIVFFGLKTKKQKLIVESQAKQIAYDTMRKKYGTELPTGTYIKPEIHCKLRKWQKEWYKWEVGMTLQFPDGRIKEKMIEIDPYSGIVRGIIDMPTGYTGRESPDVIPVFVKETDIKE